MSKSIDRKIKANELIKRARKNTDELVDLRKRINTLSPAQGRKILVEIGLLLMLAGPVVGLFNKLIGVSFTLASKSINYLLKREEKKHVQAQ